MKAASLYCTIDRREALGTAAILTFLLVIAFFNVIFLGESLIPGNAHNPVASQFTPEHYGPGVHPPEFFRLRGVHSYANMHDPGGSWWQGEPAAEILQRALYRGEFPLWDPYIGGGVPAAASLIPAYFFPPSLVIALLGNHPLLRDLYTMTILLAGGFFTYFFVRKHCVGVWGSRAAGIAFMFSGAMVQTAGEFIGQAVMGLPIVLAATACLMHRPTWRRTIATSLVYGLVSLASFPAVLIFAFSLAVVYAVAVIATGGGGAPRHVLLIRFLTAALLSLALVAFYYLPVAHVIQEAGRTRKFYVDAGMQAFHRRQIFQLLSPMLVPGALTYLRGPVYSPGGNLFYFGVSGLLLAAAAFGRIRPLPLLLLFQFTAVLLLLKIFGIHPIHALGRLPAFNSIHIAAYGGILLGFLLACMAGVAVDLLQRRRLFVLSAAGAIGGMACAFFLLLRIANAEGLPSHPERWRWEADYRLTLVFLLVAAVLLISSYIFRPGTAALRQAGIAMVALIAVEGITNASFRRQPRWNYWDHPPQYIRELLARRTSGRVLPLYLLPANTSSPYSIGSTDSLYTFNSDRYSELHHRHFGSPDSVMLRECTKIPPDSVLDAFAVDRIVINPIKAHLIAQAVKRGFASVYADDFSLVFTRPSAPRYFLTRDYSVKTREDAFYEFPTRQSRHLFIEQRASFPPERQFPPGGTVTEERFRLSSYRLRVVSPVPALLSASEAHRAGWTARVNGRPVPILRANYAFRAIEVPAGQFTVEFSYWPPGMTAGIVISAIAVLIAATVAVRARNGEDQ